MIGVNAINCQTGGSLAREQTEANTKEKVLEALHNSVRSLRRKMGASLSTVDKFDAPLEAATTPSLEALQAYSRGRKAFMGDNDRGSAERLFQSAIQLDPNFAMAYLSLGLVQLGMGDPGFAASLPPD